MLPNVISDLFVLVGLINFLPVVGLVSATRLEKAYGIKIDGSDLAILMRHRAVLFGIVGGFIIYSAFNPSLQPIAIVFGFIAMLGFIFLTWQVGDYNESIRKLMIGDTIGCVLLAVATLLRIFGSTDLG